MIKRDWLHPSVDISETEGWIYVIFSRILDILMWIRLSAFPIENEISRVRKDIAERYWMKRIDAITPEYFLRTRGITFYFNRALLIYLFVCNGMRQVRQISLTLRFRGTILTKIRGRKSIVKLLNANKNYLICQVWKQIWEIYQK